VKNFFDQGTLYIGEGVVSRTRLDSTIAKFSEDPCPLRCSEGDVFYPLPRGASVGELGETLSSSKCRAIKIHETGLQNGCRGKVQIYEKG
jgi:hypothetical protein